MSIPFSIIFSKTGYEFPSSSFLLSANAISSFALRRTSPVSLSIIDFASFLPSRNELSTTIVLIPDFSISLICFTVILLSLAIIKLPFLSLISNFAISPLSLDGTNSNSTFLPLTKKVSKS